MRLSDHLPIALDDGRLPPEAVRSCIASLPRARHEAE
jgi:hypothetical protein